MSDHDAFERILEVDLWKRELPVKESILFVLSAVQGGRKPLPARDEPR